MSMLPIDLGVLLPLPGGNRHHQDAFLGSGNSELKLKNMRK